MPNQKELSIETLRGIAIILVVAYHTMSKVIINSGFLTPDQSWTHDFTHALEYLRMPLFTTISGFVYALRPLKSSQVTYFLQGKIQRIIIPFILMSSLYYLLETQVDFLLNERTLGRSFVSIFYYGYAHFWFLQSIFLIFIIAGIAELLGILSRIRSWALFLIGLYILSLFVEIPKNYLSVNSMLNLLPYFILGYGLHRHATVIFAVANIRYFVVGLLLGFSLQMIIYYHEVTLLDMPKELLGLVVGISGILCLFYFRKPIPALAWIGQYAYGIYIFHMFVLLFMASIQRNFMIPSETLIFFISIIAGVSLPILLERGTQHIFLCRRLLFGNK